jgi:hypothetical protein
VENCACLLIGYTELGIGDDRVQLTGIAAVGRRAHPIDDIRDLPDALQATNTQPQCIRTFAVRSLYVHSS